MLRQWIGQLTQLVLLGKGKQAIHIVGHGEFMGCYGLFAYYSGWWLTYPSEKY